MPLYDFRCRRCGLTFEAQRKHDEPNPTCPAATSPVCRDPSPCGGETEKLITGGSFQLKGGGWASEGYSR